MTVGELVAWLKSRPASECVHLGAMVASREVYACPALTFVAYAEAQDALKAIEEGLAQPHQGWKGGEYRYDLDSEVYFNPRYGDCGFEMSPETLDAFLYGVSCGGAT